MPMMHRILAIDDDPAVTSWLKRGIALVGYAVDIAGSGQGELAAGLCVPRRRIGCPPHRAPDQISSTGLERIHRLPLLRTAGCKLRI
jgi:CheY-like chemotaxis protein